MQKLKQKNYKRSTSSTRTSKASGNTLKEPKQTESHTKSSSHNILLDDFIKQIKNNTVDADVYDEFFDILKSKEQSYVDGLIKEINLSETKYNLILLAVKYFECIEILNRDWREDTEVLAVVSKSIYIAKADTLDIVLTRARRFVADIDEKKKELEDITGVNKLTITPDDQYFANLITQVSRYMKFFVDRYAITVGQFGSFISDLKEYNELFKKQENAKSKPGSGNKFS